MGNFKTFVELAGIFVALLKVVVEFLKLSSSKARKKK